MSRPPLRKRLGQHHLRSGQLCRPLLDFLAPAGREVIEIGPGGGILTAELSKLGARVWALELDIAWACHLRERRLDGVSIWALDACAFPWAHLPRPFLVTGNLPFNVATPLIDAVLDAAVARPELLPRAAFMVQKEVGERLIARPGQPAYGALSLLTQARARVDWLGTVAPGSFHPPPKVAAAFIGLQPAPGVVAAADLPALRRLVYAAFAHRRKTLLNNLGAAWGRPRAEAILAAAALDGRRRAETLDLANFGDLLKAWQASEAR